MTGSGEEAASVLVRATNIGVRIGHRWVISGVDLAAAPGRVLVVTGPAGSGKTTLLHVLAGVISPTEGEVFVNGVSPPVYGPTKVRLGFVPQTFGLAAALTAAENIAIPLQLLHLPRDEVANKVDAMLRELGMENAGGQLSTELSGGQQQRTAVGRALVAEPALVIADEPTSELDAASRDLVFGLLRAAAVRGATAVVATHDPDLLARCDEVVSLHDGRVVA
jgi:putative ABC transport system ATP-binding protein